MNHRRIRIAQQEIIALETGGGIWEVAVSGKFWVPVNQSARNYCPPWYALPSAGERYPRPNPWRTRRKNF
jgi:hypothetical protein